jgi:hypothetical protein
MRSTPTQGTITAAAPTAGSAVTVDASQSGTCGIKITGTFVATLTFEGTMDGTNWDTIPAYTVGTSPTLVTGATAAGLWQCSTAGFAQFRVNCPTTYVSGTATVTLAPNAAPMKGSSSPPSAPTNLAATGGALQVAFTYTLPAGCTGNLYQGTTPGGESGTPVATGLTGTSYTLTGLSSGTLYYFTLKAVGPGGTSAASNEVSAYTNSSLLTAIAGNWNLNDASGGPYADQTSLVGSLTGNNSPTTGTGLVFATAASLASASSQWLSKASSSAIQSGGADFTFAIWFKLVSFGGGTVELFSKRSNSAASADEYVGFVTSTAASFFVGNGSVQVGATLTQTITTGVWHLFTGWFDKNAGTVNLQFDNGTIATPQALAGTPLQGAASLSVGADVQGTVNFMNGLMGPLMFWKSAAGGGGVLSSSQRTGLWNSGSGIGYPFQGVP